MQSFPTNNNSALGGTGGFHCTKVKSLINQLVYRCQSNSRPAGVKFGSGEGDVKKEDIKVHFTENCKCVGEHICLLNLPFHVVFILMARKYM